MEKSTDFDEMMKEKNINKEEQKIEGLNSERDKEELKEIEDKTKDNQPLEVSSFSYLRQNLSNCLSIINDEVLKGYVTKLSTLPIVTAPSKPEDLNEIQFFKITELVYQEEEFSVDKLAMVYHSLSNKPCTLVLLIKSDGEKTDFYMGVRATGKNSGGTMRKMLENSLLGLFPGSQISKYDNDDMKKDIGSLKVECISSVTCIADYKQEQDSMNNRDFIQGLEKFIYSLHGKKYTAIFIADSLDYAYIDDKKKAFGQIYTQLSPFANMQLSYSISNSNSESSGYSEGKTEGTSQGATEGKSKTDSNSSAKTDSVTKNTGEAVTHGVNQSQANGTNDTEGYTNGTNKSTAQSKTEGRNVGANASIIVAGVNAGYSVSDTKTVTEGTSHTDSVSHSISKTLSHGISDSYSKSSSVGVTESLGETTTSSTSLQWSETYTRSSALNMVDSRTMTDTFGTSQGVVLNAQDMTLIGTLEKLQKQLNRIEECESFGVWNFAAYFLGSGSEETETAANIYNAVVAGEESGLQRSAINTWYEAKEVKDIFAYIKNFSHPKFQYSGFSYEGKRIVEVDPSVLVSTKELAIHMGLPRHSVRGLPVVEHAAFAQEVITRKDSGDRKINLGKIYHLGQEMNTTVELDLDSLSMHTFITGSTGSGKSNAVYHIISEARRKGIPFLVVEPAKGEYKDVFADVKCYGTNPRQGELLKINPFSFPDGIHVLEHIDRIVEIFNVCWPMYAAMPAVLKEAVEQAYISAGWDLDLSENTKVTRLFPTFDDVLRELNATINSSAYSADTKGDYIGSLSTRLKSLTNGINGRIFVSDEMCLEELFDKEAIVDISRVGAMETKSLIMGLVVLKLQEYRMTFASEMNEPLKHLTILEEAHNLLKKTSTEQNAEGANMVGKSVEMLTNAIAEIRTFGEGFIIVDQAPNLLDTAAIRNTNTKIVLRLPENNDREITGGAMSLNKKQYGELSKLPTGVAAIYQNDWQESVLCLLPQFESYKPKLHKEQAVSSIEVRKNKNSKLLHLLLKKPRDNEEYEYIKELIKESNAPAKVRKDLILNYEKRNRIFEWAVADFINKNYEFNDVFRGTSKCADLEELSSIILQNIEEEFSEFDKKELYAIMYYICRIEHEKHPENAAIELLRTKYLREKMV